MKKGYLVFLSIIAAYIGICIFASLSLAVEDEDVTYPTVGKDMYPVIGEEIEKAPVSVEEEKKFTMNFSASLIGGYDTNVGLEHYDPASSFFIQEALGAEARYKLSDSLTLRGGYDLTLIKYLRFSEPDLLDSILSAGLDARITDSLLWSLDYSFDFVGYPHDKSEEYALNEIGTGLRHDIADWLYHKIIYKFSYKHYPKMRTRNHGGYFRLDDRKDTRNALEHQLGLYLTDKTLLKTDNTLYFNNSNELYLDYYDYTVFQTKATVTHLITDKMYGLANIAYQYKRYDNRSVSDSDSEDQRDHLLMSGASLFYDITPNVAVGASFNYRKNFSNEGIQKYRDYIVSSGLYAKF